MIKIEFLYQKKFSYEFQLGNYIFQMKLSKYYSYLNDKGSVRKRTKISGKAYLGLYRHPGIAP